MKSLNKRIIRDFKSNLGKYLAIFILICSIIAFGSATLVVSDSIEKTLYKNQEEKNLESGNFTLTTPFNFKNKKIEENFYIDLESSNTLRIYKNRTYINQLTLFDGELATSKSEITLDRAFANSNNIKIGDRIKYEDTSFKVVGYISVPDYTSLFKNNDDLMMNTKEFGIGFVTNETFNNLDNGHNVIYNYSFIGNKDKIKKYLTSNKNIALETFLPKELNQSISFIIADMGSDVPMMKVLIWMVIVIIAFVFVILSSNNIEMDSKTIGTLKAMGYKNNEIILHYITLPVVMTFVGAIIGNILGYTVLIEPFKAIFYTTYSLPPLELTLNSEAFILTTIIPIILMIVINYIGLKSKINNKTIDFLRNNLKKNKTRMIKLSNKIKFKTRFKLRIIFDNIGSFIVLFIGIYFASLLLIFGIGLLPIIKNYENDLMDSSVSEYQYILNSPVEVNAYKLTQYKMKTYFKRADKDLDVILMGIGNNKEYFKDLKLRNLNEGIIISSTLSKKFDIEIGDTLKLKDNIKNKNYEYKVIDIYEYKTSFAVFMSQKDLNNLLNLPDNYYNSYLSEKRLNIDEKYIKQEISRNDLGKVASQMLSSFESVLYLVSVFSVIIYLVLMYVLTKVILEKNILQISLLKVFGYNKHEIRNFYLNGTLISVIIILLISMPLEAISIKGLMQIVMVKVDGYMEAIVPLYVYGITILIGIISYLIINRIQVHKINKIPLENALKERE